MKYLIGLVIIVGLSLGAWQLYQYYGTFKEKTPPPVTSALAPAPEIDGSQLPGLPPALQDPLNSAEQHGAVALRDFLAANGKSIKDPRKAWIELDYVVLVGTSDPAEARRVFARVKARVTPDSPVYNRMQQLGKTYE